MRPRSKSVSVPSARHDKDIEDDESINSEEEEETNVTNVKAKTKGGWTTEEQLQLICQMKKIIPRKDNLPFNKRLEGIDWFHIQVENHTLKEIKTEFNNILEKTRKFRLLEEILKDMHAEVLPKLGLKKPLPAFVMFMHDHKEEIEKFIQENPKKGSFSHVGGIMFSECSDEMRESYKQKAKKCREEYDRLMSIYELPKGIREIKGRTIKYTPMQCFVQAQVLKDPKCSKIQLRKEYSTLSRKQKLKWILRWIGIRKGEKANLEQYLKCLEMLTKQEQDIFNEYEGRPKSISGYNMFMRDHLAKKGAHTNASYLENFRSVITDWKNLPEDIKKEYIVKAKQLKKNFTADFTRFVASLPIDRHDYEIKLLSIKGAGKKRTSKRRSKSEGKSDAEADTECDDEDFEPIQEKSKYNEDDDDEYDQDEEYPDEEGYDENQENLNTTTIVNNIKNDAAKPTVADNDDNQDDDDDDDDDGGSYVYQDDDRNEKIFQCDTSALQKSLEQGDIAESTVTKLDVQEIPKNKKAPPMMVLHSTPIVEDTVGKTTKANQKKAKPKHKQVLIDTMLKEKATQNAKESDEEEIPATYQVKAKPNDVASTNTSIKEEPASDTGDKSPAKSKKRKISIGENNPTEAKKVKESSTSSDVAVDLEKVKDEKIVALEKKYRKILSRKPAETLIQWYAQLHFEGSQKKAKKSLNTLTLEERESLEADYESAKTKYAKKFKAFAATLDAEELSYFSSLFEAN